MRESSRLDCSEDRVEYPIPNIQCLHPNQPLGVCEAPARFGHAIEERLRLFEISAGDALHLTTCGLEQVLRVLADACRTADDGHIAGGHGVVDGETGGGTETADVVDRTFPVLPGPGVGMLPEEYIMLDWFLVVFSLRMR